ncbi:MAG TPA: SRPBCC domain-containing protein [Bacteroidia bacterium]
MNTFPSFVQKSVLINCSPMKVWTTLTVAESISKWLLDEGVEVEMEAFEGGKMSFKGQLNGHDFLDKCIITSFDPGHSFHYDYWNELTNLPDVPENYNRIHFDLQIQNNSTLLTLTHSNLKTFEQWGHVNFYWNATLQVIKSICEDQIN